MAELLEIQCRVPAFPCTMPASLAAKMAAPLSSFLPSWITLPDPMFIHRTVIWNQYGAAYPAGTTGDVSFAIDAGGQFVAASGFPTQENATPYTLKSLGIIEFFPGGSHQKEINFPVPIAYRESQGDLLIVAPEIQASGVTASLCMNVFFEGAGDILPPAPPAGTETVFLVTLDSDVVGNNNIAMRCIVPAITTGGSQVRVRFAGRGVTTQISAASVGVRDGLTPNTVAAPVPLTFAGNPGVTLPAWQNAWSDFVTLPTNAGDDLMVTVDMLSGAGGNNWSYTNSGGGAYYSFSASAGHAAMQGSPIFQSGRTNVMDQAQTAP